MFHLFWSLIIPTNSIFIRTPFHLFSAQINDFIEVAIIYSNSKSYTASSALMPSARALNMNKEHAVRDRCHLANDKSRNEMQESFGACLQGMRGCKVTIAFPESFGHFHIRNSHSTWLKCSVK
ncbi:hypothetical protein TNIN_305841 [Trichonephila inaurata madagascariensis]|uniref:Uncharacterized protein n=1 Tax=Trichonephila inaurata madagascariensis TaxID=2747483 RepID=A0A8X6YSN5_9ARAC|nr:hypothetical protein TNIN_305841 [Trichonephila inaurata madagascariensis]